MRMEQPEKVDPATVWEAMLRSERAIIGHMEREMMEHDSLSLTWYDVLIQLYAAPQKQLRMQELAALIVLSKSGITRLLDRMEAARLVRREQSKEDRRGAFAILTEQGEKVYLAARPAHYESIHNHFSQHLTDDELRVMRGALTKLRSANE